MSSMLDWLDSRTGYRAVMNDALYERVPGGARWRYVWGSTLVFAFVTQLITGIFLWMAYSPSAQTAWESVYFIEYEMAGGTILRGVHHYMAQAMIVLLALHLVQVVIDGAYRAPREVNFWLGLVLAMIVLGLSLTGYLLPWDQKGYWATRVATNLMALVPGVGDEMQRLVVGGTDYGHHTLTRFFALHAGVLPGLLIFFLVLHLALFRKHGVHSRNPKKRPDASFWPDQVLRDVVACLAVLAFVLGLAVWRGAELGAPADPASPYSAARPEWYFLFLFQFLKYFTGSTEIVGAIVVPGLIMLVLFLMPIIGRWRLGHGFNIGFVFVMLIGAGLLTWQAMQDDAGDTSYIAAKHEAEIEAERAIELAGSRHRIPPTGALTMLRHDVKAQGRALFRQYCAVCHAYNNHFDPSDDGRDIFAPNPSAPNLYGFGSREWVEGMLDPEQIASKHFYGYESLDAKGEPQPSPFLDGDMVTYIQSLSDLDEEEKKEVARQAEKVIAALSAEAELPYQAEMDERDAEMIAEGKRILEDGEIYYDGFTTCIDCHKYREAGDIGAAPDLTGYGSRQWLIDFISNPEHDRFYPDTNDRMPAFAKYPDAPQRNQLTEAQLGIIADWLREDWEHGHGQQHRHRHRHGQQRQHRHRGGE